MTTDDEHLITAYGCRRSHSLVRLGLLGSLFFFQMKNKKAILQVVFRHWKCSLNPVLGAEKVGVKVV